MIEEPIETVKDLIEFLQQFQKDLQILIKTQGSYADFPLTKQDFSEEDGVLVIYI